MIAHVSVLVSDYAKALAFYSAALAPLGYRLTMEFPGAAGFMEGGHTSFWIAQKPAAGDIHVALLAKSKQEVEAFFQAALLAGGTDHGAPGYREDYGPGYFAAFVLDPDGNNIEAVYFEQSA